MQTFLELDARVTAQYNSALRELEQLVEKESIVAIQADVTNEDDVARLFTEAAAQGNGQRVQALVVNHGVFVTTDHPVVDLDLRQWRSTNSINLDGSFLLCREFLRGLKSGPRRVEGEGEQPDRAVSITVGLQQATQSF